jgi:hypothetical protein
MRVVWVALIAGCGFQSPPADPSMGGTSAPPADSGYDYALCPPSYNVPLPGPTRYRLITEGLSAWQQSDACMVNLPSATHLVVLETMAEVMAVSSFVAATSTTIAGNAIWIGGVQERTASLPDFGWLGFDGAPLIPAWAIGEPNDIGGNESEHDEQFVYLDPGRHYLVDRAGNTSLGALCECDGKPIAPNAVTAITANRLPP